MLLIDSCETLKERLEMLVTASESYKENNALPLDETPDKQFTQKSISEVDRQIAHTLFNHCNTQVKEIYTGVLTNWAEVQ